MVLKQAVQSAILRFWGLGVTTVCEICYDWHVKRSREEWDGFPFSTGRNFVSFQSLIPPMPYSVTQKEKQCLYGWELSCHFSQIKRKYWLKFLLPLFFSLQVRMGSLISATAGIWMLLREKRGEGFNAQWLQLPQCSQCWLCSAQLSQLNCQERLDTHQVIINEWLNCLGYNLLYCDLYDSHSLSLFICI